MSNYKYKYRVYVERLNGGFCPGNYLPEEYDKAKAHFDELVASGIEAVLLQELSLKHGWVTNTLEKHYAEGFKERKEAYWERMREEDESRYWRPGSAPWNAPGMSVSDFF